MFTISGIDRGHLEYTIKKEDIYKVAVTHMESQEEDMISANFD